MTIYGIDISNHQRDFDFAAAKREGFVFATHKVTEATATATRTGPAPETRCASTSGACSADTTSHATTST